MDVAEDLLSLEVPLQGLQQRQRLRLGPRLGPRGEAAEGIGTEEGCLSEVEDVRCVRSAWGAMDYWKKSGSHRMLNIEFEFEIN